MNTPYQPNPERIHKLRTMPYEEYLRTPEWTQKRDQTLERDGYHCRVCNSSENLHVHHRTYVRRGNENINEDLTTLCRKCHEHFHQRINQIEIMERTYRAPFIPETEEVRSQRLENYLVGLLIQNSSIHPHVCGILSESD